MTKLTLPGLATAAVLCLTGCIDDKYDLADIDSTAQFTVTDLVLPLNLDDITLHNIFDLNENSVIKDVDGQYAVVQSGTVSSESLEIALQTIAAEPINPTRIEMFEYDGTGGGTAETGRTKTFAIQDALSDFSYTKHDVDPDIRALTALDVDWNLEVMVSIDDPDNDFVKLTIRNLVLKIPKGLTLQDYRNQDGYVTIPDFTLTKGAKSHGILLHISHIDLTAMSSEEFTFSPGVDGAGGDISFSGKVGPYVGLVDCTIADHLTEHPTSVWFTSAPTMGDITVTAFSGSVRYSFDSFDVPPVNLDDLPDVFNQPGTDIKLVNPQLYISLNNPMGGYGLNASAGMQLTPMRDDTDGQPVTLDPGQQIFVGHDKGEAGPYSFCISPTRPQSYYQGFDGAEYVGCAGLSDLLAGNGLPDKIKVDFTDAQVLEGHVDNFPLGVKMDGLKGDYTIYAPLQLGDGSVICYEDTVDGWKDDDDTLDKIAITALTVTTTLKNNLPFDVELSGYPVGADGQQLKDPATGHPVSLTPVTVAANSVTPVTISTDGGTVTGLDGLHFTARAQATASDRPLSPDTSITLSDIRIKVTGTYTDKL